MPLYEYRCTKCQTVMEVIQGFKDPPPKKCEKCGGPKLEKVISRSGFVLKGSGWYQTDYKSSSASKSESKTGSKSESSAGSSSESSDASEAKPAAESGGGKDGASKKKPKGSSSG